MSRAKQIEPRKSIYIVVSQTGTVVSRLIRILTKAQYNHASISLDSELTRMYSFGRIFTHNPVLAGFVKENPKKGVFKKCKNTKIKIMRIDVSPEVYESTEALLEDMYRNRRKYHYNYIGLLTAYWEKPFHIGNNFYCSEFVKEVLIRENIVDAKDFDEVVKPIDFLEIKDRQDVYEGYLKDYVKQCAV